MFSVLGGGVAGLCVATALAERGLPVELIADDGVPASYWAGGMLAPGCEGETAPPDVVLAGQGAVDWWAARVPVTRRGTLVVAPARDAAELDRFAARTSGHRPADPGALEPDLAGRFARGLFFEAEAHLDPRAAMAGLRDALAARGVAIRQGDPRGQVIDCRGLAARDHLPDLRGVRGEMLMLDAPDVMLTRTVRLLHPRFPCYVVPRGDGRYMVGATQIESDDPGPITARAVMELLSAAYALHPGFAEARLVQTGAGLRPAFPDNIPVIREIAGRIHVNGMYRHGFLMAPALAETLAGRLPQEVKDAG
ncbi:glycine oxidase [Paracoccus alcaliphilus]|uniref:D-amino-acid oxidase n=1 Tax=Paracoccus alcaliphilus TaxID=34002 RepID=A0A1H8G9Y7_9RHOB|nr:FAD-dependent oxidoreductase [Paracoccus alcaliphilus]WCR17912.1 FAD-dependent oxidoreductase [Paracoccus alcaliphilus]SEN40856.1 glycine oxidase [Paracoccus alcaliphilus]